MSGRVLFLFSVFAYLIGIHQIEAAVGLSEHELNSRNMDGINGIYVLTDGWKHHPGDQSEWAKSDFDDQAWDTLDSLQTRLGHEVLEEVGWKGIGWFRLHLKVEPELWGQLLAMLFMQTGASEIYLDGKKIGSFGKVGHDAESEESFISYDDNSIISLRFSPQRDHVIAVRYSSFDVQSHSQVDFPLGFAVALAKIPAVLQRSSEILRLITTYQMLFAVPLAFAGLHFLLFAFYPASRPNLYHAYFAFGIALMVFSPFHSPFAREPGYHILLMVIFKFSLLWISVTGLWFLYQVFFGKAPGYFKYICGLAALMLLTTTFIPLSYYYVFVIAVFPEMLRVVFLALRRKVDGARIIGAGIAAFILTCFIQVLLEVDILEADMAFPYIYGILALMVSMSVQLARGYAQTHRDLDMQLIQTKELSRLNLEREKLAMQHELQAQKDEIARKLLEADNAIKAKELEEARERELISRELETTNRELQQTQFQLVQSEKMASLGNLVAGIAHEINTPVGAINSMHDTLVRAVDKLKLSIDSGQEIQDPVLNTSLQVISDANRVIATGTDRVTGIVRSLRNFARLDEAEMKEADLQEGLDNTLTLVQHDLKNRIEVEKEYGNVPPLVCYPSRLNQVFLNMLVNASQAIEEEGTIVLRTYVDGNLLCIEIEDSGNGISEFEIRKIFDPGFTTKGVGVGTGLGLSICYQIVHDHGGEIQVRSEVGKGTLFAIKLPMDLPERNSV